MFHGTFVGPKSWKKASEWANAMGDDEFSTPDWGGKNTDLARTEGALEIFSEIMKYHKENPDEPINFVGHSHGGNVAVMTASMLKINGVQVNTLVTKGTPVREYTL
ncbi:MAG: hypothetical protein K8S23_17440 [Candidatus Cloacimonetes bacterium]|nr:hypothetical protein [Candidatus Cloacimonadota bacterium]